MKRNTLLVLLFLTLVGALTEIKAQCTPDNCLSLLPPYGGICDSSIIDGRVNQPYYDYISFHITSSCVDLGTLDPQYSGVGAKMLKLHTFSFTGLPLGITGQTNQTQYNAPANGCGAFTGTPTEIGEFNGVIHFLANIRTWPLSTTCNGLFPIDQNNQEFDGTLNFKILPDPSFTGLDSVYCSNHAPVTLTPTGTQGGSFSGPGVTGNIFDPLVAGIGTHEIKYVVSAMEGAAVGPASDSSSFMLTVLIGHTFTDIYDICQGDSYFWRGQNYASAGTYYDSLLTSQGCDSIYMLMLNVNPIYESVEDVEICDGNYFTWRGNDYNSTGMYCDSLLTMTGCDSIFTLNLIVNNNYEIIDNESFCQNSSLNWHGVDYDTPGTYYDSLQSVNGCDSIHILNLSEVNTYSIIEKVDICQGDVFLWHGNTYSTTGIYYDTVPGLIACDTIFQLNLSVHSNFKDTINEVICAGEFYTWRGHDYNIAGVYQDMLSSLYNCDSIYTLILLVDTVDLDVTQGNGTLTANATNAIFQWVDCDNNYSEISGETMNVFIPAINGSYAVIVTQNNCSDTSDCFIISNASTGNINLSEHICIYPNPNNGLFTIELNTEKEISMFNSLGKIVYRQVLPEGKNHIRLTHLSKGLYLMQINDYKNNAFLLLKVVFLNH